ncbi:hypothetical protein [Ramlibacter sp.]
MQVGDKVRFHVERKARSTR